LADTTLDNGRADKSQIELFSYRLVQAKGFLLRRVRRVCTWWVRNSLYFVTVAVLGLVGMVAFWRSGYIAGGDVWPTFAIHPQLLLRQSLGAWGFSGNFLGSAQYAPAGVVLGGIGVVLKSFVESGAHRDALFYVFVLVAQGLSIQFFSLRLFPRSRIGSVFAGIGLPVSLYGVISVLNPIFGIALVCFSLSAGVMFQGFDAGKALPSGARWGVLTSGLFVLVSTPPLGVFYLLWLAAWAIVGWKRSGMGARGFIGAAGIAAAIAVVLNLWWIYSAYLTLHGSTNVIAFESAASLSFVNQRASLLNLLTMQGVWSWPQKIYYPWASLYSQWLIHGLLYVPAFLAIVALIVHHRRRRVQLLGVVGGLSLILAQGTHAPFGIINTSLVAHVPLFWLLRDPQGELDVSLYLVIFVLAGLTISDIVWSVRRREALRTTALTGLVYVAVTIMFVGLVAPLWSGKVIPRSKQPSQLGSENVHIPKYWSELANYLNDTSGGGAVLMLPNDDFYQMPYRWGYYGTDEVAQSLIDRRIMLLNASDGGYLSGSQGDVALLDDLVGAIREGEPIARILRSLDVRWVVERGDIVWNTPGRVILSPSVVLADLQSDSGLHKCRSFGPLELYRVMGNGGLFQTAGGVDTWSDTGVSPLVAAGNFGKTVGVWRQRGPHVRGVGSLDIVNPSISHPSVVLGPERSVLLRPKEVGVEVRGLQGEVVFRILGPRLVGSTSRSWIRQVVFRVKDLAGQRLLARINGVDLPVLPGVRWSRLQGFAVPDSGTMSIDLGKLTAVPVSHWSALGNCNDRPVLPNSVTKLSLATVADDGIVLGAAQESACSSISSVADAGLQKVVAEVAAKHIEGVGPVVAVISGGHVLQRVELPATSSYETAYLPVRTVMHAPPSLVAYSIGAGSGSLSINGYRVHFWRVTNEGSKQIAVGAQIFAGSSDDLHMPAVDPVNLIPGTLLHGELWSPPFNADDYLKVSSAAAGISASAHRGVLTLRANVDGVGEGVTVGGLQGRLVHVAVDARYLSGQEPVMKIVDENTGAVIGSVYGEGARDEWGQLSADVVVPGSDDTVSVVLYAYASGSGSVVQYRDPTLKVWKGGSGEVVSVSGRLERSLTAKAEVVAGDTYSVNVHKGARVLVMSSSYTAKWSAVAHGRRLQHVMLDGDLNGWLLPRGYTGVVTVAYSPELLEKWFELLMGIGIAGLSSYGVVAWVGRLRKDRRVNGSYSHTERGEHARVVS